MDYLPLTIGIVLGAVLGFVVCSLRNRANSVTKREYTNLSEQLAQQSEKLNQAQVSLGVAETSEKSCKEQLAKLSSQLDEATRQNNEYLAETSRLKEENRSAHERLASQKNEFEEIRRQSLIEFENIATKILDVKSERFTETNRVNITNILEPLKKEIDAFKTKVEETYDKESKQRFSLESKVKDLIEQTNKVSSEANNLATALKGQAKRQGDWGEVILERILETSGLEKGREYEVQDTFKNEDGVYLRPDVLIHLPENRTLIVDSKVSLVAYDRYCCAETDEDGQKHLNDHIRSILNHVDGLCSKNYEDITNSLDFVLMFIPIEPAYLLAIQNDPELWSRAYSKRVILISPTNLIAIVKVVSDLWNREKQTRHALEIAKQGKSMYEKFVGFLETMDDVGKHIQKTQDAYVKASNQLKLGRGNLISQAQKLANLGIGSKKALPNSMINFEDFPEDLEIQAITPILVDEN